MTDAAITAILAAIPATIASITAAVVAIAALRKSTDNGTKTDTMIEKSAAQDALLKAAIAAPAPAITTAIAANTAQQEEINVTLEHDRKNRKLAAEVLARAITALIERLPESPADPPKVP